MTSQQWEDELNIQVEAGQRGILTEAVRREFQSRCPYEWMRTHHASSVRQMPSSQQLTELREHFGK